MIYIYIIHVDIHYKLCYLFDFLGVFTTSMEYDPVRSGDPTNF